MNDRAKYKGRMAIYAMAGVYLLAQAYYMYKDIPTSSGTDKILMSIFMVVFAVIGAGMVIMGVTKSYKAIKEDYNAVPEEFCERDIPFLRQHDTKIIVNVCGRSKEDYCEVVERLASEDVDMLEINISCPNVKEGGIAFGQNPKAAEEITSAVKKYAKQPVIMKLSPNVTDITEMAKAVEAGGADAVSLINTLTGMKIDVHRRAFALANKTGGVSGPAIKPLAVRMVYQVANAVNIPIIGMGGIATAEDAIEFILAGASAVSVGTANFINPGVTAEIVDGIEAYMKKYQFETVKDMVGIVK